MQCPHCGHPDYILLVRIEAPNPNAKLVDEPFRQCAGARLPPFKEQAQKLYLEGLGLKDIVRTLGVYHKIVSRWLVQAAGQLPVSQPKTKA